MNKKIFVVCICLVFFVFQLKFLPKTFKKINDTNMRVSSNVSIEENTGTFNETKHFHGDSHTEHICDVHRKGRNYTKHPVLIYKNARAKNSHTPRDFYYWIRGLPKVNCDIPCIFTMNKSVAEAYTDAYFWNIKPDNDCANHSLNFYSTMESPARFKYESVERLKKAGYDISATMELNSDIPLPYLTRRLYAKLKRSKASPKRSDAMVSLFISNCGPRYRLNYLKELMKYNVTVHSFGKCLHNMDVVNVTGSSKSSKGEVIKKYKFYFCFENSEYKDYVSEKSISRVVFGNGPYILWGAQLC